MSRHRGMTLIELAVATTAGAALFGMAVGLLYMLLRFESASRQQDRVQAALLRLAEQFRRDVHAGKKLSALPADPKRPNAGCQLHLVGGQVVQYCLHENRLLRVESDRSKATRQESFLLPAGASVTIQPAEATAGIVSLRIVALGADTPQQGPTVRPLVIEAALGYDCRFARPRGP